MNAQVDLWLLRGLLQCDVCQRAMVPAYDPGTGSRIYSCGPACPQPDLAATPVEQDMLLGALIRGATTVHGDLAAEKQGTDPAPWLSGPCPPVDQAAAVRWLTCDFTDRHAVIQTAYEAVRVTAAGRQHPVWRYATVDLAARVVAAVSA